MTQPKHILVMRFSAMGDVAMTVPVIKELLQQNPDIRITYVSKAPFEALFNNIPRLTFIAAHTEGTHEGLGGLMRLFNQVRAAGPFDHIADLHDSLRTKTLRYLFGITGTPVTYVDKGRAEKKLLTRFPDKVLKPLERMADRYADVFRAAGLKLDLTYQLPARTQPVNTETMVGISPFAKHDTKMYPLNQLERVVIGLNHVGIKTYLFSGPGDEAQICRDWAAKYPHVIAVAGTGLQEELELMSRLNVMLSMDSAGMHLASLVGTPVVSVWGSTHHYAGFLGYGQQEKDIVADTIECRPCSVYGNKPCFRGDHACMHDITPEQIINKLSSYIN